ncbi:hypothetical protein RclHR1_08440009 [Rhizophagus clarus]|uniref:Uncharacterized protein n=1 Tax=Rhizophagus clarus TaxID=94130 RepID=A0A2Z6S0H3_9GLOM|nr:hypothetical protein RclHR1_08440009 [Rhizophagus clarus]GES79659.1 hypothetical protein GLOIN_2v1595487 [Rhizophagus clarus]
MKDFEVTYCFGETLMYFSTLSFSTDLIKKSIFVSFDVENRLRVDGLFLEVPPDNKWCYGENFEFVYTREIETLFITDFELSETVRMFFKSLIDGNAYYPNLKYVYLIGCNGWYKKESLYDNLIHFYEERNCEYGYKVLDGRDSIKEIGTNLVFWMMEDDNE